MVCTIGPFIYSSTTASHTKTIYNKEYREYGDAASYECLTNYTTYDTELSAVEDNYLDVIYPVGSIYFSVSDSTAGDVARRFGGTWRAFGAGRTIVGFKSGDDNYGSVGNTGGAMTATLGVGHLPSHTHDYVMPTINSSSKYVTNETKLTYANLPSHTHTLSGIGIGADESGSAWYSLRSNGILRLYKPDNTELWNSGNTAYTTTSSDHHQMNIGKGSLASSGSNGTATNGHSHTISTSSTNTGSYGESSPTAISIQSPYIVVYMWERTA